MSNSDMFGSGPAGDANPEEYRSTDQNPRRSDETGTTYEPTGEPEVTPHDLELEAEAKESNPNAASSAGLEGDMGLSSERTGPADETGHATEMEGIEGTGTVGSALTSTDGTKTTTRDPGGEQLTAPGQEPDDREPAPGDDEGEIRRTVGEANTADVPAHESDPAKNIGHARS